MSSKAESAFNLRATPVARAVSWLLLTAVFLGATVDVVHRHGTPLPRPISGTSTAAATTSAGGGAPDSRTDSPLDSKDCSICQFHRQLSGVLFYGPVFIPVPPARHAPVVTNSVTYFSASSSPRRGRAPPQTSLS